MPREIFVELMRGCPAPQFSEGVGWGKADTDLGIRWPFVPETAVFTKVTVRFSYWTVVQIYCSHRNPTQLR